MSVFGGGAALGPTGKGSQLSLLDTFRHAWADEDLRRRILFDLFIFAVFALGINIPVPLPGHSAAEITKNLEGNALFLLINSFGGGALGKLSIFALGMNPYITSAIIFQVLEQAIPQWKEEKKEGGEYAKQAMNRRVRLFTVFLCIAQSLGFIAMLRPTNPGVFTTPTVLLILLFWLAGAIFVMWLGEQISERGIGNGVSLLIFAGIILALPFTAETMWTGVMNGVIAWYKMVIYALLFLVTIWFIVFFTVAQRRIPVQHMRRMQGTKQMGGQTSYLPFSVNMTGVIPIIFAVVILFLPAQFASWFPQNSKAADFLNNASLFLNPGAPNSAGLVVLASCLIFSAVIFFFTYFYTALQFNVDDIADNLKRSGSFIPGIRPGKQTGDFLNNIITKITLVGAVFLSAVTLLQFLAPRMVGISLENLGGQSLIGGINMLILVQVALDTMREIEANVLMKTYNA